tara:strand:+ start:48940 stop:50445 length:1506 start_codon:yes stop_codon:yes gene_type:complete
MQYFSHLYQLIKIYKLIIDCDLPENFLPQKDSSILSKLLKIKKNKKRKFSDVLTELGPTYIKLGQFLATRPDIIGSKQSSELSNLQDNLPTFPIEISKKVIEDSFGTKLNNIFKAFDKPIAAASIAQVHKGKVENTDVAIKVLRPNIEEKFKKDFEFFYFLANFMEKFNPNLTRLKFTESINTMERSVKLEMDLRFEAAAISEIKNNITDEDEYIIPKVYWEKTAKKVLTIEWVDGVSIKDRDLLIKKGYDLKDLARIVIQSFLTQALRNGFFHADMHQGNLIINDEGKLVILDYGIMGRLGEKEQNFLAEILWGLITKNYKRTAEVHFEAGYVPNDQKLDEFSQALRAIGEPLSGKNANDISMANVLTQLFEVTEQFNMETRPELLLLQKTMVVTEGVARELDPDLNMWDIAEPIVSRWMEDKLAPERKIKQGVKNINNFSQAINELPSLIRRASETTDNFKSFIDNSELRNKNKKTFILSRISIITFIIVVLVLYSLVY